MSAVNWVVCLLVCLSGFFSLFHLKASKSLTPCTHRRIYLWKANPAVSFENCCNKLLLQLVEVMAAHKSSFILACHRISLTADQHTKSLPGTLKDVFNGATYHLF